ncbi:MAG: glycosyltransferase [Rickettsiales bacterium]|jgi:hypothetical protein|nr:glycosyltransferase [Rickettsiales bacterium]
MMMRIIHVGNGNQIHRGARYFDQTRKINNGFIRNGHDVFFISDRDTSRAANPFGSRKMGIGSTNRYFIDACYNYQPEMIVLGHADIINNESIEKVKAFLPQCRWAQWNVDAIFNPVTINQIQSKTPLMHANFITTGGDALRRFSHPGGMVCYMPNIVDASIEWPRAFDRTDQPYDVFWALRAINSSYKGNPRIEIPLYLEQQSIRIDYHGMNGKPMLFTADYYRRIESCKMGINISSTRARGQNHDAPAEELYLYSSDRLSHYMGSGLLVFAMRGHQLEELFQEDKELVFFRTKEELAEKINHYLRCDDERRAIARNGWEKSHRDFNERVVTQYIIDTTLGTNSSTSYAWPTSKY